MFLSCQTGKFSTLLNIYQFELWTYIIDDGACNVREGKKLNEQQVRGEESRCQYEYWEREHHGAWERKCEVREQRIKQEKWLKENHKNETREHDLRDVREWEMRDQKTSMQVNIIHTKLNIALDVYHTSFLHK